MIDLFKQFKQELARLNNEGGINGGYWQFRKIVEGFCKNNNAYLKACMDRFVEFPVDAIEEDLMECGPSESPLLALNELLRLREAAKDESSYWLTIFCSFVKNSEKECNCAYGLSMALESLAPAARYCYSNSRVHHLSWIIEFCISECFDECQEALGAIIDMVVSNKLSPYFILDLKARIKDLRCPDGTYRESSFDGDIDELSRLQKLRQLLDLPID